MKPPLRRQRGGAGDAVSFSDGRALLGARVGEQVAGRRRRSGRAPLEGADVAPRGAVAVAVDRPHRAERVDLRLVGVERPRVAGVDERRAGPRPQVGRAARRSPDPRRSPAGASASRRPSRRTRPGSPTRASWRGSPGRRRRRARPSRRRRTRSDAPPSACRTRRPAPVPTAARCACAPCPPRPGRPRPTTSAAPTRRAAAPGRPPAGRSPRRARRARSRPSRGGSCADTDERSSPRSARPSCGDAAARPDHPHRLARRVRHVELLRPAADPDGVEPR